MTKIKQSKKKYKKELANEGYLELTSSELTEKEKKQKHNKNKMDPDQALIKVTYH